MTTLRMTLALLLSQYRAIKLAALAPDDYLSSEKETPVENRARGTFEVKLTPRTAEDPEIPTLGRMSLDKQFHGDLDGTSRGQMLTAGTAVSGSAAYVAVERIDATLHGRSG